MIKKIFLFLFLFLFLIFIPTASFSAVTVLYPTEDTGIDEANQTTNYSGNTTSTLSSFSEDAFILQFDLSEVSLDNLIAAQLRVYETSRGGQQNIGVYEVLKDVETSEATWIIYKSGINWDTAGALNTTTDISTTYADLIANQNPGWLVFDVLSMVTSMVNNSRDSFLLRNSGDSSDTFATSEYTTDTSKRPYLILQYSTPGAYTTYYVREDGGTCGIGLQCEGTTDAPYDGDGSNEACACNNPAQAAGLMYGEDLMIIKNGEYEVESTITLPAGTSTEARTKMYGEGYGSNCDASNVKITTSGGVSSFLFVTDYNDVQCLTITDDCGYMASAMDSTDCDSNSTNGVYAVTGSTDINITDVDVYNLARGFHGAQISNSTFTRFRLIGNSSAGWDADVSGVADDGYSGLITLTDCEIHYSGCVMPVPLANDEDLLDLDNFKYCTSQDQTGYGDGLAVGANDSATWVITGGDYSHNVSDGLDILYKTSGDMTIKRIRAEGNAGQQVKFKGENVLVEDSKIIGNCAYFNELSMKTTPDQDDSTLGFSNGYKHTGYATLTGTGIPVTGEVLATGDGETLVFSGTLSNFPIKSAVGSVEIHYTIGSTSYDVTNPSRYYTSPYTYGGSSISFNGTGINYSSTSDTNTFLNVITGEYQITFTTAPDDGEDITLDYVYNDMIPSGTYTGDRTESTRTNWSIEIDGTGTSDTFKWKKRDGSYTTGVSITGSAQLLDEGVSIQFKETTGHTIGDVYYFTTVGMYFNNCRAAGTPITTTIIGDGQSQFYNNTIQSNGDILIFFGGSDSCADGGKSLLSRNNLYIGGEDWTGGDKTAQFYTESAGCNSITSVDSDYDIGCDTKLGYRLDSYGANNIYYSSCDDLGLETNPVTGSGGVFYDETDYPINLSVSSAAIGYADENYGDNKDYYNCNRSDWDVGAIEYSNTDFCGGSILCTSSGGLTISGLTLEFE